jgi:hypothetical protein
MIAAVRSPSSAASTAPVAQMAPTIRPKSSHLIRGRGTPSDDTQTPSDNDPGRGELKIPIFNAR